MYPKAGLKLKMVPEHQKYLNTQYTTMMKSFEAQTESMAHHNCHSVFKAMKHYRFHSAVHELGLIMNILETQQIEVSKKTLKKLGRSSSQDETSEMKVKEKKLMQHCKSMFF